MVYTTTSDGSTVPTTTIYRKNKIKEGLPSPLVLVGYGAYGVFLEQKFLAERLLLLDRGVIYCRAHVRGGSEMGRYWYLNGKLLNKKNTFTDFIAFAEYLIKEKYTSPSQLVINGRSAGGLLCGGVLNMRPVLFKAAICEVPFVHTLGRSK